MSTPAVTVYINGDSAQLGEELTASSQAIRDFGAVSEEAGAATKFSMLEARGSLVLLGDEFGVHIPREINRMIATIPGVGIALQELIPIMGAVWAVTEIEKYISKMREAEAAVSEGLSKSLEATRTRSDELTVSIDESQLKIDKLLGNPTSGDRAALEIAKARVEADKLAASLNKDLNEYIKLMGEASHGSVMAAILGQTGEGQAGDVTKGLRDALAKIPKDAKDYNEQAAKAVQDAWGRAAYEINSNIQTVQAELNPALYQLQANLSGFNDELDLLAKNDAINKQAGQAEGAAAEFKRTSEMMHRAMEERKRDAIEAENEAAQINNLIVAAHGAMNKELDQDNADERKMEDYWLDSGLKAEQKAADDKVKAARKAYEEAEKNAKDQEHLYDGLDKMAGEFEKKREETFKQGEDRIAKTFSESFSKILVQGGNFSKEMTQTGEKMLEEMIQQEMEYIEKKFLFAGVEKLIDATVAAAHTMAIVPFPGNFAAAASVFTATLALAGGGEVPGYGMGDTVPAMLTPGETVVTKQLTEQVKNNVGGGGRGGDVHIHTAVYPVDAAGFAGLLKKHAGVVSQAVRNEFRRTNR
jgi:hypothetical protein